jgi:hypothetical protein
MATWKIVSLDRNTEDGFVTTAHWTCSDSETVGDNTYTGYSYGSVSFDGDLTTPYADLTETQVIGWVKEKLGEETVAATEAAVAAQINAQKNPVSVTGVPWE